MTPRLENAVKALGHHALVKAIDLTPTGRPRIQTVFKYPDGSWVDVFVDDRSDLFAAPRLSDFGQTMGWLLDLPVRPWQSKKRQAFLDDVLRSYQVRQDGGALVKDIGDEDDLTADIVALGQACVRAADLIFTRRSTLTSSFTEQVEEVIVDLELPYEPNVELPALGSSVRVDFLVMAARPSAILTLGGRQTQQAHQNAIEVFRRWYDLRKAKRDERFVTVVDDSQDVYRDEDLDRLADVSDLIGLSQRDDLRDLLLAA